MTVPVKASPKHAAPRKVAPKLPANTGSNIKKSASVVKRAAGAPMRATDKTVTSTRAFVKRPTIQAGAAKKRQYMPHIRPAKSTVRYRQILAAELIVGAVYIGISASSDDDKSMTDAMKQEIAFFTVFFILFTLTSGGPSMARTSATFGGLIILGMLVKKPDTVKKLLTPNSSIAQQKQAAVDAIPVGPHSQPVPGIPNLRYDPYNPDNLPYSGAD